MPARSSVELPSSSGEREREQRTFLTPVTVEMEGGFESEDGTRNGNGTRPREGKLRRKSASTSVLSSSPSCLGSTITITAQNGNDNGFVRGEGLEIPESSPPPYMPLPPPLILPTRSRPDSQVDEDSDHDQHSEEEEGEEMIYTSWTHSNGANRASGGRYMHITNHTPNHTSNSNMHVATAVYPGVRTKASGSNVSLRHRIFAAASGVKVRSEDEDERVICTTPGMVCAGETETETDEPSRHLPTARVPRQASALSTSTSLSFSPSTSRFPRLSWKRMLFQFLRGLAIVPASLGFIWCLWHIYVYVPDANPRIGRAPPDRIDYAVAGLWALLTAHQCLSLTTGLLTRWRHYYPPLSTLVRLLALQGICWPATHLTVNILEAWKRPVIVWAVIGTTTCMSRSIQIWVVSNLPTNTASSTSGALNSGERDREKQRRIAGERGYWKKWNKWRRRRRWDWREICFKCLFPAAVLYFVMAWAGELRREMMT